jgi:hypothetical protein
MNVEHHFPDKEPIAAALKNYEMLKDEAFEAAETQASPDMQYLATRSLDVFFGEAYLQTDKNNIALQDFSDAYTALLLFALNRGKTIQCQWRGKERTFDVADKTYMVSPHVWNMAFFAAIVLDDDHNLKALLDMNIDDIITASGRPKTYTYDKAVALQAFYKKTQGYPELLTKALEQNMQVPKSDLNYDKAMDIDGPALELIYLMLTQSNEKFNAKLLDALKWHNKYYTRILKKNQADNTGLISLPLSAVIKLAKRIKHFTIEPASDYIPEYLW